MSDSDRSERIRDLFDAVVGLEPEARAARLAQACGDDAELRREVESLLEAEDARGSGVRRALEGFQPGEETAQGSSPPGETLVALRAALAERYRVEREIGRGGMATVFLAEDLKHRRRVAVKVLDPDLSEALGAERFLREIEVAANLSHPHILPLFDSGEADGFLYYVMPYLEGESLRERVAREGELPVGEAVTILKEVADALAAAHALGVVHRDIKPDNVLLSGRHAVVTDFGVAKAVSEATGRHRLTNVGVALGTPAYMAPEQAVADEHIDHRADIYALGALGYELLTGRPPFAGRSPQAILSAHVTEVPQELTERRSAVSAELGAVIMRCLEKKPADRWQSAHDLMGQLEAFATSSGGLTPTLMPRARTGRRGPRAWAVGAVAMVILGLGGWWTVSRQRGVDTPVEGSATVGADRAEVQPGFVVVPFRNQSGIDSLEWFGPVMADYLTGQVQRNRIAWVAPFSSVQGLAADRPTGSDINEYFHAGTGARYVVTGTYFSQGNSLVIRAEVADATTSELPITVGPVVGPLADPMESARVSSEQILVELARIIDPRLTPPGIAGQPRSFAAYRDYVQGMDLRLQGQLRAALDLFYRALEADSTYPEALLRAAQTEWNLYGPAAGDSLVRVAERYRDDLAPWDLAWFEWTQAWFQGDNEAIWRHGRRRAELDPVRGGDCQGARLANRLRQAVEDCLKTFEDWVDQRESGVDFRWRNLTMSLHLLGEHEKELEHARTARQRNPDSRDALLLELRALAALGRLDEVRELVALAESGVIGSGGGRLGVLASGRNLGWAESRETRTGEGFLTVLTSADQYLRPHGSTELADSLARRAVAWAESHRLRTGDYGVALLQLDRLEEARGVFEELFAAEPGDPVYLLWLATAEARLRNRDAALALSERLVEIEARPYTYGDPTFARALIAAELGDPEQAVRLLREAYSEGYKYSDAFRHMPQLQSLQGYEPFERFMEPKG